MKKTKILFFAFVFIALFVSILLFGETVKIAVSSALYICTSVVIPSLFPIMCVSFIAQESGILSYVACGLQNFCNKAFCLSGYFVPVFLISLISGYPVGACLSASLYEKGEISLYERNFFALVCCSAGPGFVLLAVGVNLYSSYTVGQILLISHILASVFTLLICLLFLDKTKPQPSRITSYFDICDGLVGGVAKGISAVISICGYTVLFFVILSLLKKALGSSALFLFASSVLEVTNAVVLLYKQLPIYLISAIIGFGGFSVIFQIFSALKHSRPSLLKFVLVRTLHATLSGVICFCLLKFIPISVSVFAQKQINIEASTKNIYFSTSLVFVLLVFLNYFYKQKSKGEYL